MKRIFILIALLWSIASIGQVPHYQSNSTNFDFKNHIKVGKSLVIPNDTLASAPDSSLAAINGFVYQKLDGAWRAININTGECNSFVDLVSITYTGSGLTFSASPGDYYINCLPYHADTATLTSEAADPTFDRYDVFYADSTGTHLLTGVAEEIPLVPSLEAGQLFIAWVRIPAASATPDIVTLKIYDENTEWTATQIGATADFNNTTNVFSGSKSINWTNVNSFDYMWFTNGSQIDLQNYEALSIHIMLKQAIGPAANVWLRWYNNSTAASSEIQLNIDKNLINQYQAISIPLSLFTIPNLNVNRLQLRYTHYDPAVISGFYIDNIFLEQGISLPGGSGNNVSLTMPSPFNVVDNNDAFNVTMPGSASQYLRGDGTLGTYDAITGIGTINSIPKSPNGAGVTGNSVIMQEVDDDFPGLATPTLYKDVDTLKQLTVENVGDGDSIMTTIDPFRTAFKTFKAGSGILFDITDTTIKVNLGGPFATPAIIERNTMLDLGDRSRFWFVRGDTTVSETFEDFVGSRNAPLGAVIIDSVGDTNDPDWSLLPRYAGDWTRIMRWNSTGRRAENRHGWRFRYIDQLSDSVRLRGDGGDHISTLSIDKDYFPMPGSTGKRLVISGHGTNSWLFANESIPVLIVNQNVKGTDAAPIYVKGYTINFKPYLVFNGVRDTIENHTYIGADSYMPAGTSNHIKKVYFLRNPSGAWANSSVVDSAFWAYDTLQRAHIYLAGNTVIGKGTFWSHSSYKFAVNGDTYFKDTLVHDQRIAVTDTLGVDIAVRDRLTGVYKYITADDLGVGGGGAASLTSTYVGVGNVSNLLSGSNQLVFDGGEFRVGNADFGSNSIQTTGSIYANTFISAASFISGQYYEMSPMASAPVTSSPSIYYNTTTDKYQVRNTDLGTWEDVATGSGVGGTPGINDVLAVGQSLTSSHAINADANTLTLTSSVTGGAYTFTINNTGATGRGLLVDAASTAVTGISETGYGILGQSHGNNAGYFERFTVGDGGTVAEVLGISHRTDAPNGSLDGTGASIAFKLETDAGINLLQNANTIVSEWIDSDFSSLDSRFYITGRKAGTESHWLELDGDYGYLYADTIASRAYARSVGGGSGEANTASNLGGGLANFSGKSGVDLQFNSFNATDFDLASNVISIDYANGQAASATLNGFMTTGAQTIAGNKTFSGFSTFSGAVVVSSAISTHSSGGAAANMGIVGSNTSLSVSGSQFQVEGATATNLRAYMYGSAATTMTAGNNYGTIVLGGALTTEAASGTHPLIGSLIIKAPVITPGAGSTAELATVYIDGVPTGVTPTGNTSAVWIKAGDTRLTNGSLHLGTAGNKLNIASGSNASIGSGTLAAGTVTINTTAVTTNSKIFVSGTDCNSCGHLYVGTITNGVSFVVNSDSGSDASSFNWWIVN